MICTLYFDLTFPRYHIPNRAGQKYHNVLYVAKYSQASKEQAKNVHCFFKMK